MAGCGPWHVTSRPSALSDWAPWVPGSRRCSPATATPSSAWRSTTTASPRGRQHLEHSTARAVARGKLSEDEAKALHEPGQLRHLDRGAQGRRPRRRGGRGVPGGQEADLQAARRDRRPGHHPGHQHLLALRDRDLDGQLQPRSRDRRALLQPRTGAGLRRDRPDRRHRAERARGRLCARRRRWARTPWSAATRPASSRTRCSSATSTMRSRCTRAHYASREDIDAAMRFGCGYPMGPLALLDLIGLDTAYEILDTMYRQGRDRLHAPAPILKQMVTAGMLGRKTGKGFYTYEERRQPDRGARRQDPVGRRQAAAQARHQAGRRRRHRHDGHRHHRGVRQGRVRRRLRRPVAGQGRRRTRDDRALAGQGDPARQARRVGQGGRARPAHRLHVARRPGPGRHRGRGDRRGPEDQDHAVREPRRDLQARRHPGDHDLLAADHPVRAGHQPARRTSSGCTSSTRRRS